MQLNREWILGQLEKYLASGHHEVLKDKKLSFELISAEVTDQILAWRNDSENLSLFTAQKNLSREDQIKFLEDYWSLERLDLILNHESRPIGVFSISGLGSTKPMMGKLMGDKNFRGRGFAKLATVELCRIAFDYFGIEKLYAQTKSKNERNIQLNKKLGFEIVEDTHIDGENYYIMAINKGALFCAD